MRRESARRRDNTGAERCGSAGGELEEDDEDDTRKRMIVEDDRIDEPPKYQARGQIAFSCSEKKKKKKENDLGQPRLKIFIKRHANTNAHPICGLK